MVVQEATDMAHLKKTINTNDICVVDFCAAWCPPCKEMETILDTLTDDYPTVTFIRLDVDKVDEILYEMPLKALPTVIIFQGAKGVGKVEGVKEIVLRDVIRKLLA